MDLRSAIIFLLAVVALPGCTEKPVQPEPLPAEADCWCIDLEKIDFSVDKVFEARADGEKLALITKEYLGDALGKQAVLIYTLNADGDWNRESVYVPEVTLVQRGNGFGAPEEAVSGGTLRFFPAENAFFYNDVSEAFELPVRKLYVRKEADGSTILVFSSTTRSEAVFKPLTLSLDGYDYPLVKIAGQLWTAENIKAVRYADGTAIPNTSSWTTYSSNWRQSPNPKAGILYSAVSLGFNGDSTLTDLLDSPLAPEGWRIPTGGSLGDWAALASFLPGASYVLASAHNVSGLAVFPSGRVHSDGQTWAPEDDDCLFWSSTDDTDQKAFFTKIFARTEGESIQCTSSTNKRSGFAVRLVKDF